MISSKSISDLDRSFKNDESDGRQFDVSYGDGDDDCLSEKIVLNMNRVQLDDRDVNEESEEENEETTTTYEPFWPADSDIGDISDIIDISDNGEVHFSKSASFTTSISKLRVITCKRRLVEGFKRPFSHGC
ncbi:uncharacterized protein LOC110690936 [Chenopodium quinoa]|uniref:uncharacterized protein LOC110690936 n=1 Tax=Chenopodium quinoa TaxID=63459 RepID=UPI000B77EF8E|nr:uncharacterized protein LOC110690936 [Chenopodium quinoa]